MISHSCVTLHSVSLTRRKLSTPTDRQIFAVIRSKFDQFYGCNSIGLRLQFGRIATAISPKFDRVWPNFKSDGITVVIRTNRNIRVGVGRARLFIPIYCTVMHKLQCKERSVTFSCVSIYIYILRNRSMCARARYVLHRLIVRNVQCCHSAVPVGTIVNPRPSWGWGRRRHSVGHRRAMPSSYAYWECIVHSQLLCVAYGRMISIIIRYIPFLVHPVRTSSPRSPSAHHPNYS